LGSGLLNQLLGTENAACILTLPYQNSHISIFNQTFDWNFGQQLADYVGVKHCVTCANGTDALNLVLMAWGIKVGDAVFVPDFTFFASGEIVSFRGATPIPYY
jgi:dTDP-4-amino-4,6-dideoxygalactose transaminase